MKPHPDDIAALDAAVGALPDLADARAPIPAKFGDALIDLGRAWKSVATLAGDVDATLQAAVVCTGTSWAEATAAVAEFTSGAGAVEIHALASARVPGPVVDTWAYQVTVYVGYPDRRGEYAAGTHHAEPRG